MSHLKKLQRMFGKPKTQLANVLQRRLERAIAEDRETRQAVIAMGRNPSPQVVNLGIHDGISYWAHFRVDGTCWTEGIACSELSSEVLSRL